MNQLTKFWGSLYFILVFSCVLVVFSILPRFSLLVGYVLTFSLVAVPLIWAYIHTDPSRIVASVFLITTPLILAMIVIDPIEMGFYGYDPYSITLKALQNFRTEPLVTSINNWAAWPYFYIYSLTTELVIGHSIYQFGKFLPLIVVTSPLFLFLMLSRLTSFHVAFISGMILASNRTLLLFEIKFVDESIASLLFFIFLFFIFHQPTRKQTAVILLLAVSILLSHPLVTLILIILFLITYAIRYTNSRIFDHWEFLNRFFPSADISGQTGILLIFLLVTFGAFFLYVIPNFSRGMIMLVIRSLFKSQTLGVSGGAIGGSGLREMVSGAAIYVLGVFALIDAWVILSRYRASEWQTIFTFQAGVLSVLYAITLVVGRVIPLDPIRLLIYIVPFLIPPALVCAFDDSLPSIPRVSSRQLVVLSAILLICTQLAAIPPQVMYSDPSVGSVGEDHYTPSQLQASKWAGEYDVPSVVGYERGIWVARESRFTDRQNIVSGCPDGTLVQRDPDTLVQRDPDQRDLSRNSVIYTTGRLSLLYRWCFK